MTPMPASSIDREAFKRATRERWDACAKSWNDQAALIGNWLREPTDAMLEMADIKPGAWVLDAAAGAGDQTLDMAREVGPSGYVLATDISPAILAFAKDNAWRAGYANVGTQVEDGEALLVAPGSFTRPSAASASCSFPIPTRGWNACSGR
jgi:ubiquinone/menaquinone biosynthesis C-methylase UbiE